MGWSIGYDDNLKRDVGYGVPAYCDHPTCNTEIDRGISYVCGGEIYGGENGCGLHFCEHHLKCDHLCFRCAKGSKRYALKDDHPVWMYHKLTDESWGQWRKENPDEVVKLLRALGKQRASKLLPAVERVHQE